MLLNHLDELLAGKNVGLENDYNRAMAALDQYYNNRVKIIATCMKEIKALPKITPGDYEAFFLTKHVMSIIMLG